MDVARALSIVHYGIKIGGKILKNFKMAIVMDDREDPKMKQYLKSRDVGFTVRRMRIGDYVIDGNIVIERKTMDDFCGSIMDGRLSKQIRQMKEVYTDILILVSGKIEDRTSDINENCIIGKMASIIIRDKINIIMLDSDSQIAELIKRISIRSEELTK